MSSDAPRALSGALIGMKLSRKKYENFTLVYESDWGESSASTAFQRGKVSWLQARALGMSMNWKILPRGLKT
jgi:hypothetical protein